MRPSSILIRAVVLLSSLLMLGLTAWAQSSDGLYRSTNLGAYPPNIGYGVGGPMMMLTASRDHTLLSPIYTDYEDIDGDGRTDFTFIPTFRYYGYFDATKCYAYNATHSTGGRFEPVATVLTTTTYNCARTVGGRKLWSGNFLNWATMTRIDVVRKTLYGGFRREDTATDTTLEMAQMSWDAHAFVKYYSGADIRDYTPFDLTTDLRGKGLTLCNRGSSQTDPTDEEPGYPLIRIAKGNYSLWGTTPFTVCNWDVDQVYGFTFGAKATAFYQKYGPMQGRAGQDPTAHSASMPNASLDGGTYDGVGPELAVRVQVCVDGKVGSERCRAYRDGERTVLKPVGLLQEFGTTSAATQAARAEFGLISGSYDQNLRGGALRKNVGSLNDEIDLNTGRFCHNIATRPLPTSCRTTTGIVKSFDRIRLYNAGDYNLTSPGGAEFVLPQDTHNGDFASWGNPMSEMMVQAIAYFAGQDLGVSATSWPRDTEVGLPTRVTASDPLSAQTVDVASGQTRQALYGKGICRPMHVLALSSGTVSYDTDEPGSSEDVYDQAGRFLTNNGRASTSLVGLTDDIGRIEGINGTRRSVGSASGGFGADCTQKVIGAGGLQSEVYSPGLSAVAGVCPEAPGIKGSYLGAGAAFLANTHAIRELGGDGRASGLTADTGSGVSAANLPAHALRVKSYAASLAGGVARIEIPVPGSNGKKKVFITPESSWRHGGLNTLMPGAMLTFKAIHATDTSGAYVVTWNDTQFGGDYDMDLVGFIRWEIRASTAKPGAYELTVLTDVLNHEAGAQGSHGFSIIGTDPNPGGTGYSVDGRYLTHGSNDFHEAGTDCGSFNTNSNEFNLRCRFVTGGMPTASGPDGYQWPTSYAGTNNVVFIDQVVPGQFTTTAAKKFLVTDGAEQVTLRDPLWYIAKYGSFNTGETKFQAGTDAQPGALRDPPESNNWDSSRNDGAACPAGACADGEPDGYFLARRPELLEVRLRQLLDALTRNTNSAPAISSAQLLTDSLKYTAEFSREEFSGNVRAFVVTTQGAFATGESWNASQKLMDLPRQVITNEGGSGIPFDWAQLGTTASAAGPYLSALAGVTAGTPLSTDQSSRTQRLINYMRGSQADNGSLFRLRSANGVLGPVVNSTPWLQNSQVAGRYTDADFPSSTPSYRAFAVTKSSYPSLLWFGSNDGMLHGIHALTGAPVLSYVPSPLAGRLAETLSVSNAAAVPLMDGSPFTADVLVGTGSTPASNAWRTYLFSGLGRGGKAVFALDVTDPAQLTQAQASAVFKWTFTASDDDDLGFQLGDAVRHSVSGQATPVVYLNTRKFGVLVPNGYRSANGRAALFILDVDGPTTSSTSISWKDALGNPQRYVRLRPRESDADNGMMGVTWVDLDNNGTADVVYGTDIKGNVWKFDIRSSNPAEWRSALLSTGGAAVPLFTAKDRSGHALPITTAPLATFPGFGGTLVSFGTGRAIDPADFPDTTTFQRFYSVWDQGRYQEDQIFPPVPESETNPVAGPVHPLPDVMASRPNSAGVSKPTFIQRVLRRNDAGQVFQIQVDDSGTPVLDSAGREIPMTDTTNALRFDPSLHDGWFFEMPNSSPGEAVLSSPSLRLNYMFFTSVRPQSTADAAQSCSQDPRGTLYAFNPVDGLPVRNLFVTDASYMGINSADKLIIVSDATPLGRPLPGEGGSGGSGGNGSGCPAGTVASRAIGSDGKERIICSPANSLRIQWREIPGLRTRAR